MRITWGLTEDCHQTVGEVIFVSGLFGFLKEKKIIEVTSYA